ncbi:MAG: hypothetical protein KDA61_08700 [Planctomycetales bacterium]|nr:hypothetical protein [Planctomycetales bacterium]
MPPIPRLLWFVTLFLYCGAPVHADYVLPAMGGGLVAQGVVEMKHADVLFDGSNIEVHVDPTVPTPLLRPLEAPNEFDPALPWSVLNGKAYNFQYGWNPGGFLRMPLGGWIWIEQLETTPGLETYQRPPAEPAYTPIFGTAETSARWKWQLEMVHNAYAFVDPQLAQLEATYRVYIGNELTGEPLPGYGSAEVTFHFKAEPNWEADWDHDADVDSDDLLLWGSQFGEPDAEIARGDAFLVWQRQFGAGSMQRVAGRAVPEPNSMIVGATVAVLAFCRRRVAVNRAKPLFSLDHGGTRGQACEPHAP